MGLPLMNMLGFSSNIYFVYTACWSILHLLYIRILYHGSHRKHHYHVFLRCWVNCKAGCCLAMARVFLFWLQWEHAYRLFSFNGRLFVTIQFLKKKAVFRGMAPCRYCANRRFGGTYRLHLHAEEKRSKSASEEPEWARAHRLMSSRINPAV
jgi:hypothetical protein